MKYSCFYFEFFLFFTFCFELFLFLFCFFLVGGFRTDNDGKSYVTPVKNQGDCGSCWAFSTTGSTECRYAIANGGTLNSLSEQQLVDCSSAEGNEGCDGGLMDDAFEYIIKEGGLCSEDEYPYTGEDGICKASSCGTKYNAVSSYTDVSRDDSTALEDAVAEGCVSVAIEADQFAFQFYSGGVLTGSCGTSLDHGVLVVGYGTDGSNVKCFFVFCVQFFAILRNYLFIFFYKCFVLLGILESEKLMGKHMG